jgi:hypothetical protein
MEEFMKNYLILTALLVLILATNCTPPTSSGPDYVGTWKGTAYLYGTSTIFNDIKLIVDETNFEIDIYNNPTDTTLQVGSIKGTHGTLAPNTVCPFTITQTYTGATWISSSGTTYVQYTIAGTSLSFLYDMNTPHTTWSLQGTFVKQ